MNEERERARKKEIVVFLDAYQLTFKMNNGNNLRNKSRFPF
jgi:hypothetical protein